MMTGFAFGPLLGSLVIRWTDNMSVALSRKTCQGIRLADLRLRFHSA